jgi:membrane protease YdiL (CAAX protease family)
LTLNPEPYRPPHSDEQTSGQIDLDSNRSFSHAIEPGAGPRAVAPQPQPRRRPRVWPIAVVLVAALAVHMLVSIFAFFIAMFAVSGSVSREALGDPERLSAVTQSPLGMTIAVALPQAAFLIPVFIAAFLSPVPFTQRLGMVRGSWPLRLWVSAAIATPFVGLVSSSIVGSLMGESESLEEMAGIFRTLGEGGFMIPLAVMIGLVPGICEELLFRGYMQTRLTRSWGALYGILATSIAFAAFHMDLVHSSSVLLIGIYLGWVAWASGSIFPAMLGHFVNNFLGVLAVLVLPSQGVSDDPITADEIPDSVAIWLSGVVLMSLVGLIYTFQHARKQRRAIVGDERVIASTAPRHDADAKYS